jgi:hypothetical protein
MKKVLLIATAFAFVGMVSSCGPSAADQKKMEEALQKAADSAANALLKSASSAATDTSKAAAPADTTKK